MLSSRAIVWGFASAQLNWSICGDIQWEERKIRKTLPKMPASLGLTRHCDKIKRANPTQPNATRGASLVPRYLISFTFFAQFFYRHRRTHTFGLCLCTHSASWAWCGGIQREVKQRADCSSGLKLKNFSTPRFLFFLLSFSLLCDKI